jgi:hypothetical protein
MEVGDVLKLTEILKYLKTKDTSFEHYYIGKLNNKNENSLGIYNLSRRSDYEISIGGEETTKTKNKNISLLIHGNKNKTQTETSAYNLFETLSKVRNEKIGTHEINYINMLCAEPIDVDTDENGIYEYVIELQIYYN